MTAAPSDALRGQVPLAVFLRAKDTHPRGCALPLDVLADFLAPEDAPVRHDLALRVRRAFETIDAVWAGLRAGTHPDHPWAREIETALEKSRAQGSTDAPAWEAAEKRYLSLRHGAAQAVKGLLPAWSPTVYKPGTTRKAENVEWISAITIDHDDGADFDSAVAPWQDHPLLAHTSWSHTLEHPKLRVIVPLAEPVPANAWSRVWFWAHARTGKTADPKCKDASRMYYLPARQWERAPYEARRLNLDRALLRVDWRELPDPAPPVLQPPPPRPGVLLSSGQARRMAQARLKADPTCRERAAQWLGARLTGESPSRRAEHIRCPSCGRPSVWFYVAPTRRTTAECQHRGSCGWWGHLDQLLDLHGVSHEA